MVEGRCNEGTSSVALESNSCARVVAPKGRGGTWGSLQACKHVHGEEGAGEERAGV